MPYPIFVFEGPDNGGKSTLARTLAKMCGGKYMHATYRFKGRMALYHLAYFRQALRAADKQPVVLDRWWPSEIAYGNTYRSGCEYAEAIPCFEKLGKDYHVSYTYCMPTSWDEYWPWFLAHYKREEEMYEPDKAKYHWLWLNYRSLMLNSYSSYPQNLLQFYNVTYDGHRGDSFCRYIMARMKDNLSRLTEDQKQVMRDMVEQAKPRGRHLIKAPIPKPEPAPYVAPVQEQLL